MQKPEDKKDQLIGRAAIALVLSHENSCGRALTIDEAMFVSQTIVDLIEHGHPELKEDITRN